MRFGDSFGDACRYCGATTIIVEPACSGGRCAVCSNEAIEWNARVADTARRQAEMEMIASTLLAARIESDVDARRRAQRRADRQSTMAQFGSQARATLSQWLGNDHART